MSPSGSANPKFGVNVALNATGAPNSGFQSLMSRSGCANPKFGVDVALNATGAPNSGFRSLTSRSGSRRNLSGDDRICR